MYHRQNLYLFTQVYGSANLGSRPRLLNRLQGVNQNRCLGLSARDLRDKSDKSNQIMGHTVTVQFDAGLTKSKIC